MKLPDKVDLFVQYINDAYFNGDMQMDKLVLKKKSKSGSEQQAKTIFNGDDCRAASPFTRRN